MKTDFWVHAGLASAIIIAITAGHGHAQSKAKASNDARLEQLGTRPADTFTKVIDQSNSPNNRLAIAVGLIDGSKPRWQTSEGSSYLSENPKIANFLIDVQRNRVVGVLDGNHFGTHNEYNHVEHAVSWSPDSRWLVETQQWKWATGTCTVHRLSLDGASVSRFDLEAVATTVVGERLQRGRPSPSPDALEGYAVVIDNVTISNDGTVAADVLAYQPRGDGESVDLSIIAKAELPESGQLSLGVVRVADRDQAGADQPATAPKPKSESEEKPKPEAEGRPQ